MSDVSSDDDGSFVDEEEDIVLDDEDTNSDDDISLDEDDDGKGSVSRADDSAFETVDRSAQASVETDYVILTLNDVVKKQQVSKNNQYFNNAQRLWWIKLQKC